MKKIMDSINFMDAEGTKRTGTVWRETKGDPNDMYLGERESEAPQMYWVIDSEGVRWTVRDGQGERGFFTSYGLDFYSDDYLVFASLKKVAQSNVLEALDLLQGIGVSIDPATWEISGASQVVASLWEAVVNA